VDGRKLKYYTRHLAIISIAIMIALVIIGPLRIRDHAEKSANAVNETTGALQNPGGIVGMWETLTGRIARGEDR
jgi:hypothetical protein